MAEVEKTGFAADGAAAAYNRLKNDRGAYETRAEDCATYTIPSVFPSATADGSTSYTTPWQSIGARGLNNLASKLMLALFPVGSSFFKLNVSELEVKQSITSPEELTEIATGLAMVERICMNYMESNSFRPTLHAAIKQLLVAGNVLLYIPSTEQVEGQSNAPKLYKLHNFVVERDAYDNVLQIVTEDKIARAALPEDVRKSLEEAQGDQNPSEEVTIYTHVYRDPEAMVFRSYQEIDGEIVAGTEGEYPLDSCPWIPVRLIKMPNEDYGRSFVEEYLGDLKSLENLYEAIVKMSMISSKVLFFVNPNGVTQIRRVAKANTGDFVAGRKQDVEVFQLEKYNDFQVAKATADDIEKRLSYAFMLNSAVQRGGDRVTAEEIRYVAGELEDTLGGVYSLLSQELQLPLVKILLKELQATSKIPNLPKEAVEPAIATGLEALGRGHDLKKLNVFIDYMIKLAGLQDDDINLLDVKMRLANSLGMDTTGLILTQQDKQAKMAEASTAAGMVTAGQQIGAAGGQAAAAMMQQQAGMPPQ